MGGSIASNTFHRIQDQFQTPNEHIGPNEVSFDQMPSSQYSYNTIFQAAKNADQTMKDAYKAELLSQLRAGTYSSPQNVYGNVLSNQEKQREMDAYNQRLAEQQAAEQAAQGDQGGWYTG